MRVFIILLPVVLGGIIALAIRVSNLERWLMEIRLGFAVIAFSLGLLLSLVLVIWSLFKTQHRRQMTKALKDEHRRVTEDRRRFIHDLDHELKNPLTAIRVIVADLKAQVKADSMLKQLNSIDSQAVRLGQLSADLRKLATVNEQSLSRSDIDIAEMLSEVLGMAKDHPQSAERVLRLILPTAPRPVLRLEGDRELLQLAFYNLVDNAIKYSAPGDTLELRASEIPGGVRIEVADTGRGIESEEITKVWNELYRGQATWQIPGAGLGLALVKRIIERHRGTTTMMSREDDGTCVIIELPRKIGERDDRQQDL